MDNPAGTNGTLASNRLYMDRFLEKLRNSGNVRLACHAAGIPRRTVYNWRNKYSTFRDEWDEAMEDACDILEAEAWKRSIDGQSDRLLMFLLTAHRPDKYKERHDITTGGEKLSSILEIKAIDYRTAIADLAPRPMGDSETPSKDKSPLDGATVG